MNYLEFKFVINPSQPGSEILIAELGLAGFESFAENEDGISAYIPKEEFEEDIFAGIHMLQSEEYAVSFTSKVIEQVNWNEEWEKNFHPVTIANQCSIRAPFHPKPKVKYDIVITPKMSFGTGHHATTHLMVQFLLKHNLAGKTMLDMGCGTGVLAILAEKKGAGPIDAIDIDNWCYQNTLENVERNNCSRIAVYEGGADLLKGKNYDVIVANINRNILLNDIPMYSSCLNDGGKLFLSGFYANDIPAIREACEKNGLEYKDYQEKDGWIALQFLKNHFQKIL